MKRFPSRPVVLTERSPSAYCGWTLLETMIAHGLLLLVMTMTAVLFSALARAERNAVRSCSNQQTLARLEAQFRRDVHRARAAQTAVDDAGQTTLSLTISPTDSVRYFVATGHLQRVAAAKDGEHRETYRLPDGRWHFAADDGRRVTLRFEQRADTVTQVDPRFLPVRDWQLEAVLSLDRSSFAGERSSP